MTASRLTAAVRAQITQDWASLMPGMYILAPMRLLRRCGPLLVGVCLDRDSSNAAYTPTFHVHMLGKGASDVSLTLAWRLRTQRTNAPDPIKVLGHEERYAEALVRLKSQAPLPLEGPLSLPQVLEAYGGALASPHEHLPIPLYEDMVIAAAWAGEHAVAKSHLEKAVALLTRWPQQVSARFGGVGGWQGRFQTLVEEPGELRRCVEDEVNRLGLRAAPDHGLVLHLSLH